MSARENGSILIRKKFRLEEYELADVRDLPDFDPEWYPVAASSGSESHKEPDVIRRRKQVFLSIYYRSNVLQRELAQARDAGDVGLEEKTSEAIRQIQLLMKKVERHYAPIGFAAEPESEGDLVIQVAFSYSRLGPPPPRPAKRTAIVSLNLPDAIRADANREPQRLHGVWRS